MTKRILRLAHIIRQKYASELDFETAYGDESEKEEKAPLLPEIHTLTEAQEKDIKQYIMKMLGSEPKTTLTLRLFKKQGYPVAEAFFKKLEDVLRPFPHGIKTTKELLDKVDEIKEAALILRNDAKTNYPDLDMYITSFLEDPLNKAFMSNTLKHAIPSEKREKLKGLYTLAADNYYKLVDATIAGIYERAGVKDKSGKGFRFGDYAREATLSDVDKNKFLNSSENNYAKALGIPGDSFAETSKNYNFLIQFWRKQTDKLEDLKSAMKSLSRGNKPSVDKLSEEITEIFKNKDNLGGFNSNAPYFDSEHEFGGSGLGRDLVNVEKENSMGHLSTKVDPLEGKNKPTLNLQLSPQTKVNNLKNKIQKLENEYSRGRYSEEEYYSKKEQLTQELDAIETVITRDTTLGPKMYGLIEQHSNKTNPITENETGVDLLNRKIDSNKSVSEKLQSTIKELNLKVKDIEEQISSKKYEKLQVSSKEDKSIIDDEIKNLERLRNRLDGLAYANKMDLDKINSALSEDIQRKPIVEAK